VDKRRRDCAGHESKYTRESRSAQGSGRGGKIGRAGFVRKTQMRESEPGKARITKKESRGTEKERGKPRSGGEELVGWGKKLAGKGKKKKKFVAGKRISYTGLIHLVSVLNV